MDSLGDLEMEEKMREMNLLVCHMCQVEQPSYEELCSHFLDTHKRVGYIFCCNQQFDPQTANDHIQCHTKTDASVHTDHAADVNKSEDLEEEEKPRDAYDTDALDNVTTEEAPATKLPKMGKEKRKGKVYTCETCGKGLSRLTNLRNHCKTHIPRNQRDFKYICDVCGKGYDLKERLNLHFASHRERKSQKCDQCGKYVLFMLEHIKNTHQKAGHGTHIHVDLGRTTQHRHGRVRVFRK